MKTIQYVAMDVHQASITAVVRDCEGKIRMRSVMETSARAVLDFLGGLRGTVWVTFEEGTLASRLALCPGTNITGDRRRSGRQPRKAHRAAQILRMAAMSLRNSRSALGAFLRRKRAQLGTARAIAATEHKLARLIYTLLKDHRHFIEPG